MGRGAGGGSRGGKGGGGGGAGGELTAKSVNDIISTMEENEDNYNYFGLRSMTQNPETGEFELANVGDTLNNSYEWDDGNSTGIELNGTSTFQVSNDRDGIEDGIREINQTYAPLARQVVLVGADGMVEYGNDPGEIILKNPVVLKTWPVK